MTLARPLDRTVTCSKCRETFASDESRSCYVRHRKCCNVAERFWQRIEKTETGCWEYQGCRDKYNYANVALLKRRRQAHRYAYELVNGPIPKGQHVLHTCDNPPCVNPDHLWLGTHLENVQDMKAKGRDNFSTKRKLSDDQIRAIRREHRSNATKRKTNTKELAAKYRVTIGCIAAIVAGRTWSNVQ